MSNDDRNSERWMQCLQAAATITSTYSWVNDSQRSEYIVADTVTLADRFYQQYDERFGLKYAEDGSGRVVRKTTKG